MVEHDLAVIDDDDIFPLETDNAQKFALAKYEDTEDEFDEWEELEMDDLSHQVSFNKITTTESMSTLVELTDSFFDNEFEVSLSAYQTQRIRLLFVFPHSESRQYHAMQEVFCPLLNLPPNRSPFFSHFSSSFRLFLGARTQGRPDCGERKRTSKAGKRSVGEDEKGRTAATGEQCSGENRCM